MNERDTMKRKTVFLIKASMINICLLLLMVFPTQVFARGMTSTTILSMRLKPKSLISQMKIRRKQVLPDEIQDDDSLSDENSPGEQEESGSEENKDDLSEIVSTLNDEGFVLVDEEGEQIPLANDEALMP
jgi:hypothetical protein